MNLFVPRHLTDIGPNPEVARVIRRVAPLTFGIFASVGEGEVRETRPGGSGVFVSPFLGLTAEHVNRDFLRFEGRDRVPKQPFVTRHSAGLFQIMNPLDGGEDKALWQATRGWSTGMTDAMVLQVAAINEIAKKYQSEMPVRYLEWQLLPPPPGDHVFVVGFPRLNVTAEGVLNAIDAPFNCERFVVGESYPQGRDRGMLKFPCFEVLGLLDHGYSGAPVIYDGRLCGIVSGGGDFEDRTGVASLWPLCLIEIDTGIGGKVPFSKLFDDRVITAIDWSAVKQRISKRQGDFEKPYAFIEPV